jgi:chromosome segregation ATPase
VGTQTYIWRLDDAGFVLKTPAGVPDEAIPRVLSAKLAEAERKLALLDEDNALKASAIAGMERKIAELRLHLGHTNTVLTGADSSRHVLQDAVNKLTEENHRLNWELKLARGTTTELDKLRAAIKILEEKLGAARRELVLHHGSGYYQQLSDEMRQQNKQLRNELNQANQRIYELSKGHDSTSELTQARFDRLADHQRIEHLITERDSLAAQVLTLKSELAVAKTAHVGPGEHNAAIEALRIDNQRLESERSRLADTVLQQRKQVRLTEAAMAGVRREAIGYKTEASRFQAWGRSREAELERALDQHKRTGRDYEYALNTTKKKLLEQEQRVVSLEAQLAQCEHERKQAKQSAMSENTAYTKTMRTNLDDLQLAYSAALRDIKKLLDALPLYKRFGFHLESSLPVSK